MAIMTTSIAKIMDNHTRAKILFELDRFLREQINDETIFEEWLIYGVPDGTEDWDELTDIEVEDFVDMWNLAEDLLNADNEDGRED